MSTPNVKTVGSGEDYETFQLHEDYADGAPGGHAAQWADPKAGSDLGPCVVSGWSVTPDTTDYYRVDGTAAERHSGKDDATGAYCQSATGAQDKGFVFEEPYCQVSGLRMNIRGRFGYFFNGDYTGTLIDRCVVQCGDSQVNYGIHFESNTGTNTATVQNTAVYYNSGTNVRGYYIQSDSGTFTVTMTNCGVSGTYYGYSFYEYGGTLNITLTNTFSFNATDTDFKVESGSPNMTVTYSVSVDDSADDWGGDGNQTGVTASDCVTDEDDDFSIKDTDSDLYNAGTTVGAYDWDIVHDDSDNWRPQGAAYDVGPFELEVESVSVPLPILGGP